METAAPRHRHAGKHRWITSVLTWIAIAIALFWTLFPFYWGIMNSVKDFPELFNNSWLPYIDFQPNWAYWERFFELKGLGKAMTNSLIVGVCSATIAMVLGVPAAYAIARCPMPNRWRVGAMLVFMSLRVFPPVAFVTPYLTLAAQFRLRDTLIALVLINASLNVALVLVIMSGVFLDMPGSLEEAAWVDGDTRWGSFSRVLLPLVAPGIVASWMLCFAFTWNEYLFGSALSFTEARTMPELILATGGAGGVNFQAASTRSLSLMAFPLLASLFVQKYIVRGLSLGAVKG